MGGDHAPDMVIEGAALARERAPNLSFILFGDEARIASLMAKQEALAQVSEIRHTDQFVSNDAKPSQALRSGRSTSMRLAVDAVRGGDAAGVVSAGNTGALMAMAKVVLRTMPGIDRPALMSFFPTIRGESVMLDLGANIDSDANNLVQFAVMGEVFARTVLGLDQPTVGLLNVGEEELKGNEAVKTAHAILRQADLPMRFHGFVEGDDIPKGTVDVVVTDGFSGNIALKTAEGTAQLYSRFLSEAYKSSPLARIGYLFARNAVAKLKLRVDPRRYNGAVFAGLNGIAVKSHGSTDALGFATAIGVAADMAANNFLDRVKQEFEALAASPVESANAFASSGG